MVFFSSTRVCRNSRSHNQNSCGTARIPVGGISVGFPYQPQRRIPSCRHDDVTMRSPHTSKAYVPRFPVPRSTARKKARGSAPLPPPASVSIDPEGIFLRRDVTRKGGHLYGIEPAAAAAELKIEERELTLQSLPRRRPARGPPLPVEAD